MRKAILHLKKADPVLAGLIGRIGPYRIEYRPPDFESLARSIVYQQLHGAAARTIFGRLVTTCGDCAILAVRPARLRKAGLSPQKLGYIRDLASKAASGEIRFESLPSLPDEAVIEQLTQVKGIGAWTAQMFLIFALKRPDVLPTADLGIRSAMRRHYRLAELPKPAEMERIAAPWRPWATVACWYLWKSLDNQAGI